MLACVPCAVEGIKPASNHFRSQSSPRRPVRNFERPQVLWQRGAWQQQVTNSRRGYETRTNVRPYFRDVSFSPYYEWPTTSGQPITSVGSLMRAVNGTRFPKKHRVGRCMAHGPARAPLRPLRPSRPRDRLGRAHLLRLARSGPRTLRHATPRRPVAWPSLWQRPFKPVGLNSRVPLNSHSHVCFRSAT